MTGKFRERNKSNQYTYVKTFNLNNNQRNTYQNEIFFFNCMTGNNLKC